MSSIGEGGGDKISPNLHTFYADKLAQSTDLFQKSLEGYQTAEFSAKRDQYKKVMNLALEVMNEAAKGMLNKQALEKAEKLSVDYHEILDKRPSTEPLSEETFDQLSQDLTRLQRSFKSPS